MRSRFAAGVFRQSDVHCIDLDKGAFTVRSSRDSMVIYSVQLQTPSCTCEAWSKNNFPCKHFYAVFNIFDEWEFSRLPDSYRNNVFITLDPDVVDSISVKSTASLQTQVKCDDGASKGNEDDDTNDQHDIAAIDENQSTSGPQEMKYSPKALRKSIREKAARVCDASYTVDDIECLKEAVQDLERIYETLRIKSLAQGKWPSNSD